MNDESNDQRLGAALRQRLGSLCPQADFEQWRRQHPEAVQALVTGRRAAAAWPGSRPLRAAWRMARGRIGRLATAAAVLFAAAAVVWTLTVGDGASSAWAQARRRLESAKTLEYTMIQAFPDGETSIERIYRKGQRFERWESRSIKKGQQGEPKLRVVSVSDFHTNRGLFMDPSRKKAQLCYAGPTLGLTHRDQLFEGFDGVSTELLGPRKIGGKEARGYRVTEKGKEGNELWVDMASGDPVLIRFSSSSVVFKDFAFGRKLDDSLFSLEIPEGYEDETRKLTEMRLTKALEWLAKAHGGVYPAKMVLPADYEAKLDAYKVAERAGRRPVSELFHHPRPYRDMPKYFDFVVARWRYVGGGTRRGNGRSPVLYYEPRHGRWAARVIYGDLHVEDVPEGRTRNLFPDSPARGNKARGPSSRPLPWRHLRWSRASS